MQKKAASILHQYWGYPSFRGEQENIIQSVLQGKDTLAILPTGGGKSICFQVPTLMTEGLCLVISPLIALMKDQVEHLQERGIPALAVHSGLTYYEVKKTLQQAASGDYKFLYLSPERLETPLFREYLPHLAISLIVVDEAHCISQWGYDFRPPYLRISNLREDLPEVPLLALTASATPVVEKDIIAKLAFNKHSIFRQAFERSNLSYAVFKVESKINKTIEIINKVNGTGIIYCRNRRQTKKVADLLLLQNISADFYHAGLTHEERSNKQNAWMQNQTRIMVCTNAFGMGIDKNNVRLVIHYDVPDCLENYYQEAGRAGRDGIKSYAILLYEQQDALELEDCPNIRFPDIRNIKKVYQSIADYLQIPIGLGEGKYYDFDLIDFIQKFNLDLFLVINVLKVLEQEGHLTFNEDIFLPSQVQFTADKITLNDIEKTNPTIDAVMKCLLRTYEGIYDNRVSINEKQMAKFTRLPYNKIYADLNELNKLRIIDYWPQKETPQLHYLYSRAPAQSLHIKQDAYFERKKLYQSRVAVMLRYLAMNNECRSKYISTYFGDSTAKNCGSCDNCLQTKKAQIKQADFNTIKQSIYNAIPIEGIELKTLVEQHGHIQEEDFWEIIEFLQSEGKLQLSESGKITIH